MNFFKNKMDAKKYFKILRLSPKKLNQKFILTNFGSLIGDKSFYKFLICYELLNKIKNVKGDIIEFGIWNGNNLFALKKMIDFLKLKKKIIGYDNFSGFPNPESIKKKLKIKKKFGIYAGNRKYISFIIKFFKLRNIKIIDDDIMNLEKHKFKKISLIYIDCDIYKTTKKILSELSNKIPIGGIIVFDEGICGNKNEEPRALKEFYNSNKTKFKKIILQKNYQPDVYLKRIK